MRILHTDQQTWWLLRINVKRPSASGSFMSGQMGSTFPPRGTASAQPFLQPPSSAGFQQVGICSDEAHLSWCLECNTFLYEFTLVRNAYCYRHRQLQLQHPLTTYWVWKAPGLIAAGLSGRPMSARSRIAANPQRHRIIGRLSSSPLPSSSQGGQKQEAIGIILCVSCLRRRHARFYCMVASSSDARNRKLTSFSVMPGCQLP